MGKLKSLCREAIFYIVTAKTIFAFSNKTRLCHNLKRNRLAVNILPLIINVIIYTFQEYYSQQSSLKFNLPWWKVVKKVAQLLKFRT